MSFRLPAVLAVAAAFAGLTALAGSMHAQAPVRPAERSPAQRCAALRGVEIPASAIGLPTNGAVIVSATPIAAADPGNNNGDFCKVLGSIRPVDPTAPDIKFEVNLPTRWNARMLQMG